MSASEQPGEPLRIGLVVAASTGGIGRHVASLASRLAERGHVVTVYCPAVTAASHDFSAVAVRPLSALVPVRTGRGGGWDVLHAHGLKAGALAAAARWAAAASTRRRPALVVTWHNDPRAGDLPSRGAGGMAARLLPRLVARAADLTLAASTDLVELARRWGARLVRLGAVAAPALPAARRDRADVRADLGLGDGVVSLTVSRLAPQKNLGLLLDIAAAVPDVSYLVVGDGPGRVVLQARIDAEGLPVRLLGRRSDISDLMAAADVAVLTSTWEARALVAQEALLAGLPLVATRVGGIVELVGAAAVLIDPADPVAAAAAVRELADSPERRLQLVEQGRRQAATWPDEDDVTSDVLDAYRQARARAGGSGRRVGLGRIGDRRRVT